MSDLRTQWKKLRSDNDRGGSKASFKASAVDYQHCGYMFKYQNNPGFMSAAWQHRFLVLSGSVVHVFKTDKDVAFFPRATVDVQGCSLEYEGLKKKRYYALRICDSSGNAVLRISSPIKATTNAWMQALARAGCSMRYSHGGPSHRPPPTFAAPAGAVRRNASAQSLARYSDCSDAASEMSGPLQRHPRPSDSRWLEVAPSSGSDALAANPLHSMPPLASMSRPASSDRLDAPAEPPGGPPLPTVAPLSEPSGWDAPNDPAKDGRPGPARHARPSNVSSRGPRNTMLPSAPLHVTPRFSYLSSERISHQQHAGLLNLGMVIILCANFRLILENLLKYGLRASPMRWLHRAIGPTGGNGNRPTLLCFGALAAMAAGAWAIEALGATRVREEVELRTKARKREDKALEAAARRAAFATEAWVWALHGLTSFLLPLAVPIAVVFATKPDPLPSLVLVMAAITVWMKLVSYAQCNYDYREARREGAVRAGERGTAVATASVTGGPHAPPFEPRVRYPENVTLANLAYFLAAPTLTYQAEFPRTAAVRSRWLARRAVELLLYAGLMLFIIDQYVEPAILNSLQPLRESNLPLVAERVLKLSLPCMYVWLTMFYLFFHVWMNVLAELTCFADREFYKDWWNATTIGEYWRLWNMPVHKWMLRTVYSPLVRLGCNKFVAGFAVFFISAILHEVAIGVPLRMVRYWAFCGMMFQLPMVHFTEMLKLRLKNEQLGNIMFWISFCIIGQPMAALLYYHDYLIEHSDGGGPCTGSRCGVRMQ